MEKLGPAVEDESLLKEKAELIFKEIDENSNGKIDAGELRSAMGRAGIELTAKELHAMVRHVDADG
jgi:Ca2+-binding EF-hand superfamily protein